MGNAKSRGADAPRGEVCFPGLTDDSGRLLCVHPEKHRGNDCTSLNPLHCLTTTEMHPVLRTVCGTEDWPSCLARLAAVSPGNETDAKHGRPGRSLTHASDLLPALCAQLPRENCVDHGEGPHKVRCRWREGECGALIKAQNRGDPNDRFYTWQGGVASEPFSWEQEKPE